VALDAAWSYPHPREGYEDISDYFAFYPGKMDACYVGKQKVKAQPGEFYGGWITSRQKRATLVFPWFRGQVRKE
jgi:hypothetical protein